MGFELTKLKYILITFAIAGMFVGCDPYAGKYPFLSESEWICDDPYIAVTYSKSSSGEISSKEYIELNGKLIEIDINYRAGSFCISPEYSVDYEDRLFTGAWEYRNGDLVLTIKEDFVFNNKYSEFVFSRVNQN